MQLLLFGEDFVKYKEDLLLLDQFKALANDKHGDDEADDGAGGGDVGDPFAPKQTEPSAVDSELKQRLDEVLQRLDAAQMREPAGNHEAGKDTNSPSSGQ